MRFKSNLYIYLVLMCVVTDCRLSNGGFENRNWRVECSEFIYSVRRVVRCGLSGNSPIVISNSIAGTYAGTIF